MAAETAGLELGCPAEVVDAPGALALGVLVGDRVDPTAWGAEVFFALLFLGLAAPLIRHRWDVAVALLSVGALFVAAEFLPAAWQITVAAAVAAVIGAVLPNE